MKRLWVLGLGLGSLFLFGLFAFPAMFAFACPACFGLTQVEQRIYIENTATPEQIKDLLDNVQAAQNRVADYFGGLLREPVFFGLCLG